MKRKADRIYRAPDGSSWRVCVQLPGSSSAMVVFQPLDPGPPRRDRYNWYQADTPEARNVTGRLDAGVVLRGLKDEEVGLLFRRSMLIRQPLAVSR